METEDLFSYLDRLEKGEPPFSPGLADRVLREFSRAGGTDQSGSRPLTPRQEEVLLKVARGQTYKDVAETLGISEATVKYHMNEILERLHLDNRAQAIAYITETGMAGRKRKDKNRGT